MNQLTAWWTCAGLLIPAQCSHRYLRRRYFCGTVRNLSLDICRSSFLSLPELSVPNRMTRPPHIRIRNFRNEQYSLCNHFGLFSWYLHSMFLPTCLLRKFPQSNGAIFDFKNYTIRLWTFSEQISMHQKHSISFASFSGTIVSTTNTVVVFVCASDPFTIDYIVQFYNFFWGYGKIFEVRN